jgi:hypothetical protein
MSERLPAVRESAETAGRIARSALKEIIKDAMREVIEETETISPDSRDEPSSRGPPAGLGLLLVGLVLGFFLATRISKPSEAVDVVRERSPVNSGSSPEEPGETERSDRTNESSVADDAEPSEDVSTE